MDKIIELYKKAYKEYALSVCEVEIQLNHARATRLNGKSQSYFNSSQNRNTFARIASRAYMLNEPVTITQICEMLCANRSSVSIMVDECEKEGWITVTRGNNKALCMATPVLNEAMMKYVYYKKKVSKSIVGNQWNTLDQLESVLKAVDLEIPDLSFGEMKELLNIQDFNKKV